VAAYDSSFPVLVSIGAVPLKIEIVRPFVFTYCDIFLNLGKYLDIYGHYLDTYGHC
jgi:hypothetical protein